MTREAEFDDVEEVHLDKDQIEVLEDVKAHCRENFKKLQIRDQDYIIRTCIEEDFDKEKIIAIFNRNKTDEKYEGLKDYNWQVTETRQQKEDRLKRKREAFERKKQQEIRRK